MFTTSVPPGRLPVLATSRQGKPSSFLRQDAPRTSGSWLRLCAGDPSKKCSTVFCRPRNARLHCSSTLPRPAIPAAPLMPASALAGPPGRRITVFYPRLDWGRRSLVPAKAPCVMIVIGRKDGCLPALALGPLEHPFQRLLVDMSWCGGEREERFPRSAGCVWMSSCALTWRSDVVVVLKPPVTSWRGALAGGCRRVK